MYLLSHLFEDCCGCMACIDSCPTNAIQIVKGEDSYLYPYIDNDKCIDCKTCELVCPNQKDSLFVEPIDCFSGRIKDNDAFQRSSSGGAFEAIIKAILKNMRKKVFVAGAIWTEDFKVIHKLVEIKKIEDIYPFCKSKYVQSNPKGVYNEVKRVIDDENNLVVFSGTPCQVLALRKSIQKKVDNLITIDLICHGCPSQEFFDNYKNELESKNGSKLVDYKFKNKEILDNGTLYTRSSYYLLGNGDSYKVTRHNDPFLKKFYLNEYLARPSCTNCFFKQSKRVGDVTIGDAWGIEKRYPGVSGIHGVSAIVFNSDIVLKLRESIVDQMTVFNTPYDFLIENNSGL